MNLKEKADYGDNILAKIINQRNALPFWKLWGRFKMNINIRKVRDILNEE